MTGQSIVKPGKVAVAGLAVAFVASACSLVGPDTARRLTEPEVVEELPALERRSAGGGTPPPDRVIAERRDALPMPAGSATPQTAAQETRAREAPSVTTLTLRPRPKPGPFRINLYRKGDFMHQQTKDWCVAGSTQTMMNIIDKGKPNRSARFQRRLYVEGRRLSANKKKLGPIGVDLTGWMDLLNTRGYGPYEVTGTRTRRAAIRKAARALRLTGRPVGLVTWRGAHSWVMSGFTATADPAYSRDFRVKEVFIQDTWYPYVSTIWGASRPPNAAVPVAALAEDYLPYRRPLARYPGRDGKFMLILPTLPPDTVAR